MSDLFDLFIIGGGINGMGIAADAAGRGLRVGLCEAYDFASSTSSASSKLIHGGLRYLEHYEFRLIRESLKERSILLSTAKHLVHPQPFVLPLQPSLRPAWVIRCGLWLYDHLYWSNPLPASLLTKEQDPLLKEGNETLFEFYDCTTEDTRLVLANAHRAHQKGATLYNYTRFLQATRHRNHWSCVLEDTFNNTRHTLSARVLVNAAGPWALNILQLLGVPSTKTLRLVKGSHLLFKRFTENNQAYCLQHADKRIIFVVPYQRDYTLVGTTDVPYTGDPKKVHIDTAETHYLITLLNHYFKRSFRAEDIVSTWSGVRPLLNDGHANPSQITRDYSLEIDASALKAPLLSVFGGKLTSYRRLAEKVLSSLGPFFKTMGPAWTATEALPGSDFIGSYKAFEEAQILQYPWLPKALCLRYTAQYGTHIHRLLEGAHSMADLGPHLSHGLYEREERYLKTHEWAKTKEDILWRRTKLGLLG